MTFGHTEVLDDGVNGLDCVTSTLGPLLGLGAVDLRSFDQGRKNRGQAAFEDELGKVSDGLGEASTVLLGHVQLRQVRVDQLKKAKLTLKKWGGGVISQNA